jgi:hypothetical protein
MTEYRKTEAEHPLLFNIYFYGYVYPRALWTRRQLEKQITRELKAVEDSTSEDMEFGCLAYLYGRVVRFEKEHPYISKSLVKAKLCIYDVKQKLTKIFRKDATESD